MSETVLYSAQAGVATLRMNRPERHNGLDLPMVQALDAALDRAQAEGARAVVLTGAEGRFCVGADLQSVLAALGGAGGDPMVFVEALHALVLRLRALPMPLVCAINGTCAGGGLGLALAGDLTWAAESATFTPAFTAIGLSPDTGTAWHLPRAVGARKALELFLTNPRLSAAEALDLGIVARVVPDDAFEAAVAKLAGRIARGPTAALVRTRALVDAGSGGGLAAHLQAEMDGVREALASADFMEGVAAFVQKRAPAFTGA
jgi:2-(1,2-epoxy-1,2-dihydrophenyl)acetyl-CoA isomerase